MKLIKLCLVFGLAACTGGSRDLDALRAAVDGAQVRIGAMATVAEGSMQGGRVLTAELRVDGDAVYAFGTLGDATLHDVRIDTLDGQIVSSVATGAGADACPDAISISEAIAIAEGQVAGGTVIAAIPDDDVACARELQVLAPDLLWEVKVGGDGQVLELEESDETED